MRSFSLVFVMEQKTSQMNKRFIKWLTKPRTALMISAWILSVLLAAALTFTIVIFSANQHTVILKQAMDIIRTNFYFYNAENDGMIEGAIDGMTQSLGDPYATYYNAEEYAQLTKTNSGYYSGIGVVLRQKDIGYFEIIQVYADTPAMEAGIQAGDRIIELNGLQSDGNDLETFLSAMRTSDGEENILKVVRDGKTETFSVTAREIYAPTVIHRMVTDEIGYLHISGFHGECVTEVKEAVEEMRENGMKSLILDVRDNPGGSLYDVCDVADLFLPKGLIITSLKSRTEKQKDYKTEREGYSFPMVLLINAKSASASELLAGALKDHGRAYLIGTRTYGKGIVQSYFPVTGTGGYIKITTEAYYTPGNVCIHGIGIEPDETVELSETGASNSAPYIPPEDDAQLLRAVRYLESL